MESTEISKNYKLLNPGNIDAWYGPYNSLALANAAVPSIARAGKTVGVISAGVINEYVWHPGNITDVGLVIKTGPIGPAGPSGGSKIPVWTATSYAVADQVNYLGKDWVSNTATLSTDVPGTSTKWVERLSAYSKTSDAVFNITSLIPLGSGLYYTPSTARQQALTSGFNKTGVKLTYLTNEKWVTEEFSGINTDTLSWNDGNNWIDSSFVDKKQFSENVTKYYKLNYDYINELRYGYYTSTGALITVSATNWRYISLKVIAGQVLKYKGQVTGASAKSIVGWDINNNVSILLENGNSTNYTNITVPAGIVKVAMSCAITLGDYSFIAPKEKIDFQNQNISINSAQVAIILNRLNNVDFFTGFIAESVNSSTGLFTASSSWARTGFIAVSQGDVLLYTGVTTVYNPIIFYDSNYNYISGSLVPVGTYTNLEITIPANVVYMVAVSKNQIGDVFSLKYKNLSSSPWDLSAGTLTIGSPVKFKIQLKTIASATNQPFIESTDGYYVFQSPTDAIAVRYYLIPKGNPTGVKTKFEMFYTDYVADSSNYSAMNLLLMDNCIHIGSNRNGSTGKLNQIFGGSYFGSALEASSARIEMGITDSPILHGRRWTINEVLNLKPSSQPSAANEGDMYNDSTLKKIRYYNGTSWLNIINLT